MLQCLTRLTLIGLMSFGMVPLPGCGGATGASTSGGGASTNSTGTKATGDDVIPPPPAASIANPLSKPVMTASRAAEEDTADLEEERTADEKVAKEPENGSAEWLIREILRAKVQPLVVGPDLAEGAAEEEIKGRNEAIRQARKDRNEKIIALASEAIGKTLGEPEKDRLFAVAVGHFLEAHLQLAMQGDEASTEALYDAAKMLGEKRPGTAVASQAAYTLVTLTHQNALKFSQAEPKWLVEFAREAESYAIHFPKEQDQVKSLPMLLAAARSCEANKLPEQAAACYRVLVNKFPNSIQSQQCAGVLRRLDLVGKPLQLAGPTLDGNFVSIEEMRGKGVLVVFWSTNSQPFIEALPAIQAAAKKYEKFVRVVGVNLDTEELALDRFLKKSELSWTQIFHSEKAQRGWNAPLAVHYGVSSVPTMWLIDPEGIVASTDLDAQTLDVTMRDKLKKFFKKN